MGGTMRPHSSKRLRFNQLLLQTLIALAVSLPAAAQPITSSISSNFNGTAIPAGINPVTWTADFSSETPGICLNWKWAAAVYTTFSTDYNALGVKPIDPNTGSDYLNSDHAGPPAPVPALSCPFCPSLEPLEVARLLTGPLSQEDSP